jgi:TrwC relaxase
VALPVKALKAGQESYWLDQIARNREQYFSGRGESPGRFVGNSAAAATSEGVASAEQVQAMFQGLDPATGEQRCAPLLRADPRSKLATGHCWPRSRPGPPSRALRSWRRWPGPRHSRGGCAIDRGGLPARRRQAGKGGDGRAGLPQGSQGRPG